MAWCGSSRRSAGELAEGQAEAEQHSRAVRRFSEFLYATLTSRSRKRRVVGKDQLPLLFSAFASILFEAQRRVPTVSPTTTAPQDENGSLTQPIALTPTPLTHGPRSPTGSRPKLGPNPAPTALSGDCVRNPGYAGAPPPGGEVFPSLYRIEPLASI